MRARVCAYVSLRAWVYACASACMRVFAWVCIWACVYSCVCACVHSFARICVYLLACACICSRVRAFALVCVLLRPDSLVCAWLREVVCASVHLRVCMRERVVAVHARARPCVQVVLAHVRVPFFARCATMLGYRRLGKNIKKLLIIP